MISLRAYEIYQWVIYAWFCVGVGIVGLFSFRDIFHIITGKKSSSSLQKKK